MTSLRRLTSMIVELLAPVRIKLNGQSQAYKAGDILSLAELPALKLLARGKDKVRLIELPPFCLKCGESFYCPTCSPEGRRACACDHLRTAAKLRQQREG